MKIKNGARRLHGKAELRIEELQRIGADVIPILRGEPKNRNELRIGKQSLRSEELQRIVRGDLAHRSASNIML